MNSKSTRRRDYQENDDVDKNMFKIQAYGTSMNILNTDHSVNSPSVPQSFRENIDEAKSPEFMQKEQNLYNKSSKTKQG